MFIHVQEMSKLLVLFRLNSFNDILNSSPSERASVGMKRNLCGIGASREHEKTQRQTIRPAEAVAQSRVFGFCTLRRGLLESRRERTCRGL